MAGRRSRVQVDSILTAVSSQPTAPGLVHRLAATDHAMGLHSLHVIFYYDKNPFNSFDLDPIRICLSELLSMYPPVTGRVTRNGSGNWEVKCNDAGVRVLRAKVEVGMDEWLKSADGDEERDLTVWEDMPEDPSTWSPFRIQINEFEGGGMAIGLSCSHLQADPTSLTLLFKSWTEAHRCQPLSHPPSFSARPQTQTHTHINTVKSTSSNHPATKFKTKTHTHISTKMATATFKFSSAAFKKCLSEINGEFKEATPFDVFAALFWTRVAHVDRDNQTHSLSVCVDSRALSKETLSYGFFGNALLFSKLSLGSEEMGFEHAAQSIHRHIASLDENEVRSTLEWLESQNPPPSRVYGQDLTCLYMEHMMVNEEPLMYSAFFENRVRPAHVSYQFGNVGGEGLIIVMPSPEEAFGRTVAVTLPEEEMKKLLADQEILRLKPKIILSGGM